MIQSTALLNENDNSKSTKNLPVIFSNETGSTSTKLRSVLIAFFTVLTLFIITHLVKFPGSVAQLAETTHGQKTLDLQASFSSTETYERLTAFGEVGRAAYMQTMLTVDLIFPVSMFIFLFLLGRYSLQRLRVNVILRKSLLSLSIGYVGLDFLENLFIFILLSNFPNRLDFLGTYIGYLTLGKRISMIGALFIPLGLLVSNKISSLVRKSRVYKFN